MATTNGISLAPDNLEEEVAHLMSQELPYTVFDTDTEVAVDSMLNAKLEFDEALLTENVSLHCGAQGSREVEMQGNDQEIDSEEDDSSHYFKFSRTVMCDHTASGSDTSGQLNSAQSIPQLDGADGGSETESEAADEDAQDAEGGNEEAKIQTNHTTPTKQLTVALKRLESIYTVPKSPVEEQPEPVLQESLSPSALLESAYTNNELSVQEEEVPMTSETSPSQNEVFLDSSTGHFVPAEHGSAEYPNKHIVGDRDDSASSADSDEGFKDDLNDPDYSPEPKTKKPPTAQMKTVFVKTKHPAPNLKRLAMKPSLPLMQAKLPLPPHPGQTASVSSAAVTFHAVPRPVAPPAIINGLNALNIQPGASLGKTIAINLISSKPESQQQAATENPAGSASTPPVQASTHQVLLVNRHGQIMIKDPKLNTYQPLSTDSPTYNKISQIAKILHSGNALQRSMPHVIIKPRPSPSAANAPPAPNLQAAQRKIIVKMVPMKSNSTAAAPTTVSMYSSPESSFSNIEESTAQAIIDRAMATHRDAPKTKPIILSSTRQPKAKHRKPLPFPNVEDSDQSSAGRSESPSVFGNESIPAASRHQVRVKRVSSVSERPSRKKSKMDFLKDPSSEPEDTDEAR